MAGLSLTSGRNQQQGDQRVEISSYAEGRLILYDGSNNNGAARGLELWQPQHLEIHGQGLRLYDYSSDTGLPWLNPHELGASMRRGFGGGTREGNSCQDCGNQAKKDCTHLRCRTCCKSRGFHCTTHVKSTWVPIAIRRRRQQQRAAAASMSASRDAHRGSSQGSSRGAVRGRDTSRRRARDVTTSTRLPAVTTMTSGSNGGGARYPQEFNTHAAFRRIRMSTPENSEDEFAYQTAVSIGGHVFRGIVYDYGPEPESRYSSVPSYQYLSQSSSPPPPLPTTTYITATAAAAASAKVGASGGTASGAVFVGSYPTPLSAFMAGTQFFPHHSRP